MGETTNASRSSDRDMLDGLRRAGVVASVWDLEDARSIVDEDEACAHLSAEQVESAARWLLSWSSKTMGEMLGERGNDFLSDSWMLNGAREEVLDRLARTDGETPDAHAKVGAPEVRDAIFELERRGYVVSAWGVEDARAPIDEDEQCQALSDEEVERAARTFLGVRGKALEEALAERGNGLLADRWAMHGVREEVLANIGASVASKP